MIRPALSRARFSFLMKAGAAALLVALADFLFFDRGGASTVGGFVFVWTLLLGVAVPAILRHRTALAAGGAALLFALALVDNPNLLALALFWTSLTLAALLWRFASFDTASRWFARLFLQGVTALGTPLADLGRLRRLRPAGIGRPTRALLPIVVVPLIGSGLFVWLFAIANPLIANSLSAITLPPPTARTLLRVGFWILVLMAVWPTFRPAWTVTAWTFSDRQRTIALPGVSVASITLSLILFNAIFALQNGLDIAFLWSEATLPAGVTLAEYAHRGAYALIATALLAGLFVLVTLRPGTDTAADPRIRGLVILWIGQNLLLVASSILRTLDYVDVYSLTELRIAALAWMVLVAIGLLLICWRMLKGKSAAWLINRNAAAALAFLAAASVVDLGAVAAGWNVRHAREVGGRGAALDLCYLRHLGPPALLPLIALERRPLDPVFRDRVAFVRAEVLARLEGRQAEWHRWTWRNARRLAAAQAALAAHPPVAARPGHVRDCDGRIVPPPPSAIATPPRLTAEPRR